MDLNSRVYYTPPNYEETVKVKFTILRIIIAGLICGVISLTYQATVLYHKLEKYTMIVGQTESVKKENVILKQTVKALDKQIIDTENLLHNQQRVYMEEVNTLKTILRKNQSQRVVKYINLLENSIMAQWRVFGPATIDYVSRQISDQVGVSQEILISQIKAESGFNPLVISHTQDVGIAQLSGQYLRHFEDVYNDKLDNTDIGDNLPTTLRYQVFNPLNPVSAILAQGLIMDYIGDKLKKEFNVEPSTVDLLASYNMGVYRYADFDFSIPYNHPTGDYVQRIVALSNSPAISTATEYIHESSAIFISFSQ